MRPTDLVLMRLCIACMHTTKDICHILRFWCIFQMYPLFIATNYPLNIILRKTTLFYVNIVSLHAFWLNFRAQIANIFLL